MTIKDIEEQIANRYNSGEKPPYYVYMIRKEYDILEKEIISSSKTEIWSGTVAVVINTYYGQVNIVISDEEDC